MTDKENPAAVTAGLLNLSSVAQAAMMSDQLQT